MSHYLRAEFAAMLPERACCAVAPISADERIAAEERPLVARAVASRRREFAAGRRCARAALVAAGGRAQALGRGPLGEPVWPAGYVGSITHGTYFAAAVASPATGRIEYGIDLVDDIDHVAFVESAPVILTARESRRLGGTCCDARQVATIFAAKEAAIKILSPRLGRLVDFRELDTREHAEGLLVDAPTGETLICKRRWAGNVLLALISVRQDQ